MDVCLHVGLPKAGSTMLQQAVFGRLAWLDYHALARKAGRHAEDGPFGGLVRTLREGHGLGTDWDALRDWFAAARDPGRPALVSEERFSDHLGPGIAAKAAILRRVFGPARVLIVIRRPDEMLPSMFFQERRHARYGLCRGRSLDAWVRAALDHADHHLSPAQMIRPDWIIAAFDAVFGAANVSVLPLEWLAVAPAAFASRLAAVLDGPAGEIAACLAAADGPANARPRGLASSLRALRGRPLRSYPRELAAALATGALSPDLRARVHAFTADAVERTMRRTALPLADLGYLG
jgi:hypothetical protein